jgi:hypothetical protein
MAQLTMTKATPSQARELRTWTAGRHYLHSVPPGYKFILEFTAAGKRQGTMIFGIPANRTLDRESTLQLHRMIFIDTAPHNTESHALSMARKFIRTHHPQVRLLITYCDPTQQHYGTVFIADGWAPFGATKAHHGYGWKHSRQPQAEIPPKTRWLRTP